MSQTKNAAEMLSSAPVPSVGADRRAIPQELNRINSGQVTQRVEYIRRHNQTLSPEEIQRMLNWSDIEKGADDVFFKYAQQCETARNIAILLPLLLTWFFLGLAASAFAQNVAISGKSSTFTIQSFLYLWAQGFPDVKIVPLLFFKIPTAINFFAGTWHYLNFGDLVFFDTLLLLLIVIVTASYHVLEWRGQRVVATLRIWIQKEVDELSNLSLVRSLGPGPENVRPVWAVEVHTAIQELKAVLGTVQVAVHSSGETFSKTVESFTDSYRQQHKTVGELINTVGRINTAVDQLNSIYQQGKETYRSLEAVLPRIEESFRRVAHSEEEANRQLQDLIGEMHQTTTAIDELARPFAAVNLATLAQRSVQNIQNTANQQSSVMDRLERMETRLIQNDASAVSSVQAKRWRGGIFGFLHLGGKKGKLKKKVR